MPDYSLFPIWMAQKPSGQAARTFDFDRGLLHKAGMNIERLESNAPAGIDGRAIRRLHHSIALKNPTIERNSNSSCSDVLNKGVFLW